MVVDIVCLFKVKHSMDWLVMIIDNFVSYTSYVYKSMTILLVSTSYVYKSIHYLPYLSQIQKINWG